MQKLDILHVLECSTTGKAGSVGYMPTQSPADMITAVAKTKPVYSLHKHDNTEKRHLAGSGNHSTVLILTKETAVSFLQQSGRKGNISKQINTWNVDNMIPTFSKLSS